MAWICPRSTISGPKRHSGERLIERANTWFKSGQAQTTHLDCNISLRQILVITGLFRLSGLLALAQPDRPKVSSAELSDSFEVLLGRGWPVVVSGRLGFAGHGAWTGSWWLMNDDDEARDYGRGGNTRQGCTDRHNKHIMESLHVYRAPWSSY